MPEQQNKEYKSSWHDDYLKWICGFANSQGGRIYIGKDDAGVIVGVEDYQDFMDEIPNKIKNLMGIIVEVNLLQEDGKPFIEKVFSLIYVFILRGHQRTSEELSRKEGGKNFGSGSRTPIAITILVKKKT